MDEITITVPRALLERLRDLAVDEEGPQPTDVFSEAFDAWRTKALLVRTLNDALS